ncbi:MAG: hypothetical protein FWE23_07985 [Chitinivibrionia bacterium]|nr:hypothetical protein [Chitinivibrionia bacterium]
MRKTINNDKGASLVYVLIALVFVGAIAMLVLNSARKETIDSSLRASSEMARFAATGGLTYAITLLTNPAASISEQDTTTTQQFLTDLFNDPTGANRWLVGNADGANAFHSDGNGGRFRVQVVNIDFSQIQSITEENLGSTIQPLRFRSNPNLGVHDSYITIQLRSEAIDASGSRAQNIGVYQIFGYEGAMAENLIPTTALFLGGGMDEINTRLIVTADPPITSANRPDAFLRGGGNLRFSGHRFDGEFRRRGRPTTSILSQATNPSFLIQGTTFNGPVFLGLEDGETAATAPVLLETQGSTFNAGLGSDSRIVVSGGNAPTIFGGAFLNGDASNTNWNGAWSFPGTENVLRTSSGRIYGAGASTPRNWMPVASQTGAQFLFSATPANNRPSNAPASGWTHAADNPMDLFDSLGISPVDPPAIDIDLSQLTEMTHTGAGFTGGMLNDLFESAAGRANRDRNNGWMVVRWRNAAGAQPFNAGGDGFTGKMVLILDERSAVAGQFATNFFRSAPTGNTLIILEDGATAQQLGNNSLIRGLIINRGTKDLNLQTSGNMVVRGAVFSVGTGAFRLEGGGTNSITIIYDPNVLREIIDELPRGTVVVGDGYNDNANQGLALIPDYLNPRGPFTELWNRWY